MEELGFALGIKPQVNEKGEEIGFELKSGNNGLPDEVVITLVKHWLKAVEDNYHQKFKQD